MLLGKEDWLPRTGAGRHPAPPYSPSGDKGLRQPLLRSAFGAIALTAACALTLAGSSLAAAPPNDSFTASQELTGISGSLSTPNVEATKEIGEPEHAGIVGGHSVWFRWTAPTNGGTTIETAGSAFDTLLAVYNGVSVDALTQVSANDNATPGVVRSKVHFAATAGTTYQIAVDGKAGATGTLVLSWAHFGNPTPPPGADPTLLAAGDIAGCGVTGDEATGLLISTMPGTVVPLGDIVYESGSPEEFAGCYATNWGNFKERTRPTPGNHEYYTPGAAGYFGYFGTLAGDPAKGYYSYDLGAWHVVSLNGNCEIAVGCEPDSQQDLWLAADLAAHPNACTLAYAHQPRFSSGADHGSHTNLDPLWQTLYDAGVDLALAGHDHTYERMAPQNPSGAADATFGIREFVVGTGGGSHDGFATPLPTSEVRAGDTFGVLKLTLRSNAYEWQFVPEAGKTFTDSGSGTCHGPANRIANGTFETGLSGWRNWQSTVTQASDGIVGAGAARVSLQSGVSSYSMYSSPRPVQGTVAGTSYFARGWLRSDTPGRIVCLRIREWSSMGSSLGQASACRATTSAWQRFPVPAYTTAGSGGALEVYVYASAASAGDSFEIDDVRLREGTPPPDISPPDTSIVSGPTGDEVTASDATFSFAATETPSTFQCALDGGGFSPCSDPKAYTGLGLGPHTFQVRAIDAAGNVDPTPAGRTWNVVGPNILANGSFEGSLNGWRGWQSTLSLANDGTVESGAAKILSASGSAFSIYTSPRPVSGTVPGRAYTARGWVRSDAPPRSVCLRIREWSSSGSAVGSASGCLTTGGAWKKFPPVTYTTTTSGGMLEVFGYGSGFASGSGFELDGLSLRLN